MEDTDKPPMPSAHVDDLRTHLNKISKLSPELDDWEYRKRETGNHSALDSLRNPEIGTVARAVISAAFELRKALFHLEHLAQEIVKTEEKDQDARMTRFFDREGDE